MSPARPPTEAAHGASSTRGDEARVSDSPVSSSPYEILGVSPTATTEELRVAYRRRARATHPDTGGAPAEFHAVQLAWERVGTEQARRAYDLGSGAGSRESQRSWAPTPTRRENSSRPLARSSGHPGGWHREQYLAHIREWAGRGVEVPDPYDPTLVRRAPHNVRHLLAAAVAEENTARSLAQLGIAYTIWHDVATTATPGVGRSDPAKIDHVVLGPTGLWAILSDDWGGEVRVKRGELIGDVLEPGERPVRELGIRAKDIARAARVKFGALAIAVPDDATDSSDTELGSLRGARTVLVQQSRLAGLVRQGLPGVDLGGTDLFEARTRLQRVIRFV